MNEYPTLAANAPATQRGSSLTVLMLVGGLIGAAVFLLWRLNPTELSLPLCGFHSLTGLHCPGCGATRATHELLHGRLGAALHDNALWVLTLPLVVYAIASEVRQTICGRGLPGNPLRCPRVMIAVGVAAAVFGVLRNVPHYPFDLLAPLG
ncbi:MAG: DUF2752 domain-containing protein [Pirellulales bacterium]|nr:DUF2752 domain-containing protein [Pirellulales bacterium]